MLSHSREEKKMNKITKHNKKEIASRVRHWLFVTGLISAPFANERIIAHLRTAISDALRGKNRAQLKVSMHLLCNGHADSCVQQAPLALFCPWSPCTFSSSTWNLDNHLFCIGPNLVYRSITIRPKTKNRREQKKRNLNLQNVPLTVFCTKRYSPHFENEFRVCECVLQSEV